MAIAEAHAGGASLTVPPRHCRSLYLVFMGDGCNLMEDLPRSQFAGGDAGVSGKLIGFYDHNGISIDGKTDGWFAIDDTAARFPGLSLARDWRY